MKLEIGEETKDLEGIVNEIITLIPEALTGIKGGVLFKLAEVIETQNRDNIWGHRDKYILLRSGSKYQKIYLRDIIFAETYDRKIIIHTKDKDVDFYGKLTELENSLGRGFYRTHRAFLVNMEYVKSFDIESVQTLKGEISMSKAKYQGFVKLMKEKSEISL